MQPEAMASLIHALWRVSVLDIETTLRSVCSRALGYAVSHGPGEVNQLRKLEGQSSPDDAALFLARARGLSILGQIFIAATGT